MLAEREQLNNKGREPFHSLLIFGHVHNAVPFSSQKTLVRALESDMAGAELDVPLEFSLLEVAKAAGGVALNYPMKTIQQEPF